MEHFSHKHPLILVEKQGNDDESIGDVTNRCGGCRNDITDHFYRCAEGCGYYLHKVCAELPREMNHPLHSISHDHPLTLLLARPNCNCDACGKSCRGFGFFYQCSPCKFDLDIICAAEAQRIELESAAAPQRIELECHPQHPLFTLERPALFYCDACGTRHEGSSYKCSVCGFWVHQDCASLPSTIKHSDHDHPLTLARPLTYEHARFRVDCKICNEDVGRWKTWAYYCLGCRYYAHINCINSKKETTETQKIEVEDELDPSAIHLPMPNDFLDMIIQLVKKTSREETKAATELDYFGHRHALTLFDRENIKDDELCLASEGKLSFLSDVENSGSSHVENNSSSSNVENYSNKRCRACTQPISAPLYSCTECSDYFLHKCCAELPIQIHEHPFHPEHPLDLQNYGIVRCSCCMKFTNGFYYSCAECEGVDLDVKCGSIMSNPIKHEAHDHRLFLRNVSDGYCKSCRGEVSGPTFKCDTCYYILHSACAMLPKAVEHRYDEHPFILQYSPVKNHPSEYYCAICEEEMDPKYWFYHCDFCDVSIHSSCFFKFIPDSIMWYGTLYRLKCHAHPLILIQVNGEYYKRCSHCCERLDAKSASGFECPTCKLKLHFLCVAKAHTEGKLCEIHMESFLTRMD